MSSLYIGKISPEMKSIFIIVLLAISYRSFGQELQENFVPVRPLGMGNAFTAIANDENAIWVNPAGTARARKARTRNFYLGRFPNVGFGMNKKTRSFYNVFTADKDTELSDKIAENEDLKGSDPYYANIHAFPVMLFDYDREMPGAVGLYTNSNTLMVIEDDLPEQARVSSVTDAGGLLNFAWTDRTNRLTVGVNFRYITRYAYEDTVPTNDLSNRGLMSDRLQQGANQTVGLGVDVGGLFTFADFWFPTLGFAILNLPTGCKKDYLNPHSKLRHSVCGIKYSGNIGNEDALSVIDPTDFRLGLSITPRITRKVAVRLGLDVHHLYLEDGTNTYGLSGVAAQKMIHAGAELFVGNPLTQNPLSFRAGINQGFITSGFSIHLPYFAVDFATYGVDVSSSATQLQDRRYVGTISMLF